MLQCTQCVQCVQCVAKRAMRALRLCKSSRCNCSTPPACHVAFLYPCLTVSLCRMPGAWQSWLASIAHCGYCAETPPKSHAINSSSSSPSSQAVEQLQDFKQHNHRVRARCMSSEVWSRVSVAWQCWHSEPMGAQGRSRPHPAVGGSEEGCASKGPAHEPGSPAASVALVHAY